VGQLAVGSVGFAPLGEERQNLGHLLIEQPVHRRPARRLVGQLADGPAGQPAVRADFAELQFAAGAAQRPALIERLIKQLEQAGLGGRVEPARDPTT